MRWAPLLVAVLAAACAARAGQAPEPDATAPDAAAIRLAIEDLIATFGEGYPGGPRFLKRLDSLADADPAHPETIEALAKLRDEALLANPLLGFDRLLLVRRKGNLGLPQNWQGNCVLPRSGFDNEIATISPVRPGGKVETLYRPESPVFVGDVDLGWDAKRMLFSSVGANGRWHIFEIGADGRGLRQVTPDIGDVDAYDACYLPDGRIVFGSTASFQGVPCVGGRNQVANLYLMNADGSAIRQLTFDQDHGWCPAVLADGRVVYTRWEYSDIPHYFSRLLFRMNPDGTSQMALYGSNSYWPNSLFYVRPVPGHPTKLVGIVSGHHGVPRMGELYVFDPSVGQAENQGAVQQIPGHGRPVRAPIVDGLVNRSWPRFLHPWPLSEKYFLVACQPTPKSPWGIWLVDTFDNFVCIAEEPGAALLEPVPLVPRPRPPAIPDRVRPDRQDATVYLTDVYRGPGLAGVPRGTVKRLRVFAFDYGYRGLANHTYIGIDGPWDVHRILGTVPVEADGSAVFSVPANTPIAIQPLDDEGRAIQIMRSWFTAMPGENLSCVGCHEPLSEASPPAATAAMRRPPSEIEPFYGPPRGFSFPRDVQPVLDAHCVRCHDGSPRPKGEPARPDLRHTDDRFSHSYEVLQQYVRRPRPESDYHLLAPGEYHASTSELVQMLEQGHHGVTLDREAWDRLVTWIDLNVPCHGTWHEYAPIPGNQRQRRRELRALYAGLDVDYEAIPDLPPYEPPQPAVAAVLEAPARAPAAVKAIGWPFAPEEARRRQAAAGPETTRTVEIGKQANGTPITFDLVLVPAGEMAVTDAGGSPRLVRIERPFWVGRTEVTNQQFACFDPDHDSRYLNPGGKDQSSRGIPMNGGGQPVVRLSWERAEAFCRWLSDRSETGLRFRLPTRDQWEWACRAGAETPFWFGPAGTDFSPFANLADATLGSLGGRKGPQGRLADRSSNDRSLATSNVGRYQPNPWGLVDMHGNAAEWTASEYASGRMAVRGGSFYDRPHRATASFERGYPTWQPVFDVGLRVVAEAPGGRAGM